MGSLKTARGSNEPFKRNLISAKIVKKKIILAEIKLHLNSSLDPRAVLSDPMAFDPIYLHKYFHICIYFIHQVIAYFSKHAARAIATLPWYYQNAPTYFPLLLVAEHENLRHRVHQGLRDLSNVQSQYTSQSSIHITHIPRGKRTTFRNDRHGLHYQITIIRRSRHYSHDHGHRLFQSVHFHPLSRDHRLRRSRSTIPKSRGATLRHPPQNHIGPRRPLHVKVLIGALSAP